MPLWLDVNKIARLVRVGDYELIFQWLARAIFDCVGSCISTWCDCNVIVVGLFQPYLALAEWYHGVKVPLEVEDSSWN